jgi:hypothetical protein
MSQGIKKTHLKIFNFLKWKTEKVECTPYKRALFLLKYSTGHHYLGIAAKFCHASKLRIYFTDIE